MASVAKNTAYLTVALVGQRILSFIYFTILARVLGVESIGKYFFVLSFTTIFAIFIDLGSNPVLIREFARDKLRGQEILSLITGIKIFLSIFVYCLVLFTGFLLGYPNSTIILLAVAGAVMILDSFHLTFYGVLRGLQNLSFEAYGMIFGQIVTITLGSFGLMLKLPLVFFVGVLIFGSLFNIIWSARALKKNSINIKPKIQLKRIRQLALLAAPFALAGVFTKIYGYIDTVLLSLLKGDVMVGWYSIAYKITYAFQFLPMALSAALFPAFSKYFLENKEKLFYLLDKALVYSLTLAAPIVLGIAILAPEIIITIYGEQYSRSIIPLRISIFGLLFIFLYFPLGSLLNATNRQNLNTAALGVIMTLNVLMNIFLIPRFEVIGASLAALVSNIFLFIFCLFASNWPKKIFTSTSLSFLKILTSAIIMTFVVFSAKKILFWPLTILLGALVYASLLILFKVVKLEEIRNILRLFSKTPPQAEPVAEIRNKL